MALGFKQVEVGGWLVGVRDCLPGRRQSYGMLDLAGTTSSAIPALSLGRHEVLARLTRLEPAIPLDRNVATIKVTVPATHTVTKIGDTNDGVCDADCSLREAIAVANSRAILVGMSGDTVIIPTRTYTLSLGSELAIDKN